jgi:hypothetical protein
MDEISAWRKKIQGFPHVFTFENFKTALMGDIKLWSSRHYRRRYRRYRRHRRSRSKVETKEERCKRQNVSHGMKMMDKKRRRGDLPFVRHR